MIKKLIAPLALVVLLSTACKKENEMEVSPVSTQMEETPASGSRLLTTPATFTQKLLIEMFGTVGCGTCPDMEQKCRSQMSKHPNTIYGYHAHNSDAMDIGLYDYLDSIFNVTTYASGMLNRTVYGGRLVMAKQYWSTYVNTALAKTANCGVQITSSISSNTATVTVDAGFNSTLSGNYRLTTVLCEDSVIGSGSGYNQANYYNNISGTLWYGLGNPMIGYKHDFVSRKVLSASKIGDVIGSTYIKPGGFFTKTYTVNISAWNPQKLYVISFINKVGSTSTTHEVMNVQSVKLGSSKNFD